MLKDIFTEQRRSLDHFFENLEMEKAERFVEACKDCTGMIFFTGLGKSGFIAQKIAMTLVSTGTKALYLPPSNFLHGDIGIVSENDVFIIISKSGETEDLLNLVPFVKRKRAKLLTMVSHPLSRLAKEADLSITLPVDKELCPFDMMPTISTEVQLMFGDVLAVALMKAKQFSMSEYSLNHPAGTLGKKMTLKVKDLMIQGESMPLCHQEDRLVDMLVELSNKKCGCLLIVDNEQKLTGIFTDGDLRRALQAQGSKVLERKMGELMTPSARFIAKDVLVWEAVKVMQRDPKRWIMMMPVIEENKVVGLIRMHDIVQTGISS